MSCVAFRAYHDLIFAYYISVYITALSWIDFASPNFDYTSTLFKGSFVPRCLLSYPTQHLQRAVSLHHNVECGMQLHDPPTGLHSADLLSQSRYCRLHSHSCWKHHLRRDLRAATCPTARFMPVVSGVDLYGRDGLRPPL
jgi:hypothetical protein